MASLCLLLTTSAILAGPTCRIIFPERPSDSPKAGYIYDGSKNHKVTFPDNNFSRVIQLSEGSNSVTLSATEILASDATRKDQLNIDIPEGCISFYVIMMPDIENKEFPVKLRLIDCGPQQLAKGETLWINLTSHHLKGQLGGANLDIAPLSDTITREPTPTSGHYTAKFTYQKDGEGDFAPITEQSWWHDNKSRHLGFISDTGGKLPKVFCFRDFRLEVP